jgi:hypothetical protein
MKLGVLYYYRCADNENDKQNIATHTDFVFYHMNLSSLQMELVPLLPSSQYHSARTIDPQPDHKNENLNYKQNTNFLTV